MNLAAPEGRTAPRLLRLRGDPALDIGGGAREEARLIGPGEPRMLEGKRSVIGRMGLPVARPGMTVGLLGGSFDPAHDGHAHITREALKRLGLDRVWWLVSPGNPLKARGPAPMADRLVAARAVMRHPRVTVTDIEARIGTRFTAETLAALQALYPGVRFVWLMGADNLAGFHRWERWPEIAARVPMAVFARPGAGPAALGGKAARRLARWRVAASGAAGLALRSPPAWAFLEVPKRDISSTRLRAGGGWRS